MLSFAIPGTVIGIGYILAFNVPPIEITGTGVILVVCFIFRNMPTGIRAGIAAMSQLRCIECDIVVNVVLVSIRRRSGSTV